MVSERGQEEAPFELLIAVIIMAFVIFLGLQAMNYVQAEQCKASIKKSVSDLHTVIQSVVSGNGDGLAFYPPQCFSKEKMNFVVLKDDKQCSSLCHRQISECFVFSYRSNEYNYDECFNTVPPATSFYTEEPCNDAGDKFIPVNMKENIPHGTYEFVFKGYDNFPKVCAYLVRGS